MGKRSAAGPQPKGAEKGVRRLFRSTLSGKKQPFDRKRLLTPFSASAPVGRSISCQENNIFTVISAEPAESQWAAEEDRFADCFGIDQSVLKPRPMAVIDYWTDSVLTVVSSPAGLHRWKVKSPFWWSI